MEPPNCSSNYWLQTLKLNTDRIVERDAILKATNQAGLMTRPAWRLMHQLKPYANCPKNEPLKFKKMVKSLLNIPSSPELDKLTNKIMLNKQREIILVGGRRACAFMHRRD